MLTSSQVCEQADLELFLRTRSILTGLWKNEAPQNTITWYPAQKKIITLNEINLPLTPERVGATLLKVPKALLPCLLTYAGGLLLKPNSQNLNQLVHEASTFSPWDAVEQISANEFEVTPVSFNPLGRRAALKVAGSIIEAVCPLCPFADVCNRTLKPHTGSQYSSDLNYYPGILVDI